MFCFVWLLFVYSKTLITIKSDHKCDNSEHISAKWLSDDSIDRSDLKWWPVVEDSLKNMLSHVIRSLNRQTFKSLQSQNYVKRFYSNQEFQQKNNDDDYSANHFRFHDWDDTTRVYQEYYKRYYDDYKNKFDNSGDRQTDNDNNEWKNRKRFDKNYSFNECKYHVFTKRLIEKIGYIVSVSPIVAFVHLLWL